MPAYQTRCQPAWPSVPSYVAASPHAGLCLITSIQFPSWQDWTCDYDPENNFLDLSPPHTHHRSSPRPDKTRAVGNRANGVSLGRKRRWILKVGRPCFTQDCGQLQGWAPALTAVQTYRHTDSIRHTHTLVPRPKDATNTSVLFDISTTQS